MPHDITETLRLLERAFGPFTPGDGLDAPAIERAERRLGHRLPHALAELHRRLGNHPMEELGNRLTPLDELELRDDILTIGEEQQGVCIWGLHRSALDAPDPPVVSLTPVDERWEIATDFPSISAFAAFQCGWKAAEGALPFAGISTAPTPRPALHSLGTLLAAAHDSVVIIRAGAIIVHDAGHLSVACNERHLLDEIVDALGLTPDDWDFLSHRD